MTNNKELVPVFQDAEETLQKLLSLLITARKKTDGLEKLLELIEDDDKGALHLAEVSLHWYVKSMVDFMCRTHQITMELTVMKKFIRGEAEWEKKGDHPNE